ncbi:MAG: hypothetical protein ACLPYZ_03370 [Limisphaerales bacterium]
MTLSKFFICILSVMICGCGPSAKQIAEQQARQRFRESVGAVKVCTTGSTYTEFREKRLALETSYAANQSALANETNKIDELVQVMRATDSLWSLSVQMQAEFLDFVFPESRRSEMAEAMKTIKDGSGYTWAELKSQGDFPRNYVRLGLSQISSQCDDLLK